MGTQKTTPMTLLELYFKDTAELAKLLTTVIKPMAPALKGLVLTFKGKESAALNVEAVQTIEAALSMPVPVHAVWSAKNAYVGTGKNARGAFANRHDATFAELSAYARDLSSASSNIESLLLVSGAGNKKELDSVNCLHRLQQQQQGCISHVSGLTLGVAFNPHIGGALDPYPNPDLRCQAERSRLANKLKTGLCAIVWVNFGADAKAADDGLSYLKDLDQTLRTGKNPVLPPEAPPLRVIGSLFIPSQSWLNKMRFRCWAGCFLGEKDGEYLGSLEGATKATSALLEVYRRHGVETLVESSVRTEKEMKETIEFLGQAHKSS